MKSSQRIRQTLQKYQRKPVTQQGILGNEVGVISVPNRTDYVYVRVAGLGTISVYNKRVPLIQDLPVDVGYDPIEPKNFQVLNIHRYPQGGGRGLIDVATTLHGKTHNWAGIDPVYIEKRQLMPLRPTPMGGMQVYVTRETTYYDNNAVSVTGQQLDLAPYVPATGSLMVLIYKDTDEIIKIQTGGVLKDIFTLSLADAPQAYPGTVPIALVRLYGGQSGIAEGYQDTDIIDVRQLFSPIDLTGTSSGPVGHVIQDEGTSRTQRTNLNFKGSLVWAVDNAGNDSTDIIISGTSGIATGTVILDHDHTGDAGDGGLLNVPYWFNVNVYGAVGNGVANDTSALQDAIDAAHVNGGIVWIPQGTYLCDALTTYDNVYISGEGLGISIIKANSAVSLLSIQNPAVLATHSPLLENFTLEGNSSGTIGLDLLGVYQINVNRVAIRNFTSIGLKLRATLSSTFRDCEIVTNVTGIDANKATLSTTGLVQANLNRFEGCRISWNTTRGIYYLGGASVQFVHCDISANGTNGNGATYAFYFKPTGDGLGLIMSECWFETNWGGKIIWLDSPDSANQYSIIEKSIFQIAGASSGIVVEGTNKLICRDVHFFTDYPYGDFWAYSADSYIFLDHCIGSTVGPGTIDFLTAPLPSFTDPTTTEGDMIYKITPSGYVNLATVALGASATANPSPLSGHEPAKLIDEDDATYWAADGSPVPGQWVKVDLGAVKSIGGYRLLEFGSLTTDYATSISIYGSSDDSLYTKIMDDTITLVGGPTEKVNNFPAIVAYRYVKIVANAGAADGWAIYTVEIYDTEPTLTTTRLPVGNENDVLMVTGGIPAWQPLSALVVTGSHTIMDEGATLPYEPVLNFIGNSLWAVDNAGQGRTDIIVSGTSSGGGHTIENEGTPLTQRSNLNFVGASVNVTDDAGNDRTVVTVSNITGSASGDVSQDGAVTADHLAVWSADNLIKDGGVVPAGSSTDGWIAAGQTWTYEAADDPTYTFSEPIDATTKYSPGMKIKCTQGGSVKYGIITAVGAYSGGKTIITAYWGTDYDLGATITNPYYSTSKAPFGFPLDPIKWTVELLDTTLRGQATPTQNVWYNPGPISVNIPIGTWDVSYQAMPYTLRGTGTGVIDCQVTLSTANNSESNANMTAMIDGLQETSADLAFSVFRSDCLVLASKTAYYFNMRTTQANCAQIYTLNSLSKLIIRAKCVYL